MIKPLISIVVPIYKVEKYIRKCVDSIINQTYENLEIILVDDGSPDSCPQICDEYAKKDKRIKVIHKENGGLSDARNKGIEVSTGEYVGFVDSDDYIDNEMYEYLYGLLSKHDADISMCGFRKVFENGDNEEWCPKDESLLDRMEGLKTLSKGTIIQNYAWNKLYKKELFIENDIFYPKGRIMEDIATTYKLIDKSKRVVIGNKSFYNYLIRPNSIMSEKSIKVDVEYINHLIDRFNYFKKDSELNEYFYSYLLHAVINLYSKGDKKLNKYLNENNILNKVLTLGKENSLDNCITNKDTFKIKIIRLNPFIFYIAMKIHNMFIDKSMYKEKMGLR